MPIGIFKQGELNPLGANAIYQLMSISGDGTGGASQNVNGSVTPVKFYIQPPSDEKYTLKRMNVHGIDGNWNNASQYGALGTALAVGIKIYTYDQLKRKECLSNTCRCNILEYFVWQLIFT